MKKKLTLFIIVTVCFLSLATTVTVYATHSNIAKWIIIDLNEEDESNMIESKQLTQIEIDGAIQFGEFRRQEAVAKGEIKKDDSRVQLDQVSEMIADGMNFSLISEQLDKIQPEPDFVGGSGVINVEYWLDDDGIEKIIVTDVLQEIWLVSPDVENGATLLYRGDDK